VAFRRPRRDPSEIAYERLRADAEPRIVLPARVHQVDRKRLAVYAVLFVLVVAVFRDGIGRGAPEVEGSCDRPAFALDRTEVRQDYVVKWAVRGPSGAQVVITANSADPAAGRLLGPLPLKDCHADGRFGVPLPDGEHLLRVFLQTGGTTTLLGDQELTVNAPR
jgi:hypothetical protein